MKDNICLQEAVLCFHSVEAPSIVESQWNMLYWGSRWTFHTVCWGAVGCEWGATFVYFGIIYVCFIPIILHVFDMGPQYQHWFFYSCQKYHLKDKRKIFKNIPCWYKTWMGVVTQILIKLETSSIWGFPQLSLWCRLRSNLRKHSGVHPVTSEACTSLSGRHSGTTEACEDQCGMDVWKFIGAVWAIHRPWMGLRLRATRYILMDSAYGWSGWVTHVSRVV